MGCIANSSFYEFEFDYHDADMVNCGDSIWSDGQCVQIADYVEQEDLQELLSLVENRKAFKGALRRVGFDVDLY